MTVYSELSTPHEMSQDGRATGERLSVSALGPAPGLRYEDRPREVRKRPIEISEAAAALAAALHLHLD